MYWSQPIEVEEIQHPWRQDSTRLFPLRSTIFKAIPVRNLRPSQTPPPLVETHGDAQRKWGLESCKIVTHWMQHEAIIALSLPWANARCVCVCVCASKYIGNYVCSVKPPELPQMNGTTENINNYVSLGKLFPFFWNRNLQLMALVTRIEHDVEEFCNVDCWMVHEVLHLQMTIRELLLILNAVRGRYIAGPNLLSK